MKKLVKGIYAREGEARRSCFDPYNETSFGNISFFIDRVEFSASTYDRNVDYLEVNGEKVVRYNGEERIQVCRFIQRIWDERQLVTDVPDCILRCI